MTSCITFNWKSLNDISISFLPRVVCPSLKNTTDSRITGKALKGAIVRKEAKSVRVWLSSYFRYKLSFSSMTRSPYCSANSRSWDTTMTSFSSESFLRVSSTCLPVFESSAPVGSSASIISGFLTRALSLSRRVASIRPTKCWAYALQSSQGRLFPVSHRLLFRPCSCPAIRVRAARRKLHSVKYLT